MLCVFYGQVQGYPKPAGTAWRVQGLRRHETRWSQTRPSGTSEASPKSDADSNEEQSSDSRSTDRALEGQQIIDDVVARGFQMWLGLSHWAKNNNMLESRERSLAYNVGDRIRKGVEPSLRQATWAIAILGNAVELGFDVA